jgi:hypothetical protein
VLVETTKHLPRGIALVRARTPKGTIVWVSPRCSVRERRAARLIASYESLLGHQPVVVRLDHLSLAVAQH